MNWENAICSKEATELTLCCFEDAVRLREHAEDPKSRIATRIQRIVCEVNSSNTQIENPLNSVRKLYRPWVNEVLDMKKQRKLPSLKDIHVEITGPFQDDDSLPYLLSPGPHSPKFLYQNITSLAIDNISYSSFRRLLTHLSPIPFTRLECKSIRWFTETDWEKKQLTRRSNRTGSQDAVNVYTAKKCSNNAAAAHMACIISPNPKPRLANTDTVVLINISSALLRVNASDLQEHIVHAVRGTHLVCEHVIQYQSGMHYLSPVVKIKLREMTAPEMVAPLETSDMCVQPEEITMYFHSENAALEPSKEDCDWANFCMYAKELANLTAIRFVFESQDGLDFFVEQTVPVLKDLQKIITVDKAPYSTWKDDIPDTIGRI
ncbi:hypothetical protein EIP86_005866 [Pleurotus ostreatoroseus]|nr:hypothetical protein EIP86_005866 [Pleurotus ostreatoroseus]